MYPVVGLLAAAELLGAAPAQELTLEQVVKANVAAIQAIRSIHVTIETDDFDLLPGEKPLSQPRPSSIIEWFKDGDRERVRKIRLLREPGAAPESDDIYNGPDGWRRLDHYDPNFKPPLSESISAPARGTIDKPHPNERIDRRYECNMDPFGAPTEEYLLKHPSTKLAATPATSKLGCYEITRLLLKREDPAFPGGAPDDVKELRVFVDPKAGFWIRRTQYGPWQKGAARNDKITGTNEITEFKDCGNGIFFPMHEYSQLSLPDGTTETIMIHRYTLHSINQPLTDENFHIQFPDWLRVHDEVSGKYLVWGPDDKPRMEFASVADYKKWYKPRARDPFQPEMLSLRSHWTLLVGISVAVALLLLIVMAWRRRATRAAERPSPTAENTQGDASIMP